jgi:hypothetical protein
MPFVEGKPPVLPLPAGEAVRVGLEVAGALAHAHAAGILHRDVKPSNILRDAVGRPMLADFGLAIPSNSGSSRWAVSGTPEYASPEQIRGDVLDARTDVYSLGATLYHLLTGRPPFSGRDVQHIAERVLNAPPPPMPGVPSAVVRIVRRAMERDLALRYARMEDLEAELRRWLQSTDPARGRSRRFLVGILLASLIPWAIMGGLLLKLRSDERAQEARFALDEARRTMNAAESLRVGSGPGAPSLREALQRTGAFLDRAAGEPSLRGASAVLQGRLHELGGREAEAEASFRRAGPLPEARLGLARIAVRRLREVRGSAADVLAHATDDTGPSAVFRAFAETRWSDVVRLGAPLAVAWSHDEVLVGVVGRASLELGKADDALKRIDAALKLRPGDPVFLIDRARARALKGDAAGAKSAAAEALQALPEGSPLRAAAQSLLSER